jgi:L-threonylcarbamoyladenylate synthase
VAQALLREFKGGKGGLAAPSANKFGRVSPTTAQHVQDEFGDEPLLKAILEGGQSAVGIESTILDLSRLAAHGPVLLRPGHISAAQIADVIGVMPAVPDAAAPRASGTLAAHYAPHTAVALVESAQLDATIEQLHQAGRRIALIGYRAAPNALAIGQTALPATPEGFAYGLYAALRAMDAQGADLILIEAPPADHAWQGVNDRLRRAAHDSAGILERLL